MSKVFTEYAAIEFQKAQAIAAALENTPFMAPEAFEFDPTTGRVEFEYIPQTTRLMDEQLQAYQTGHVEDVLRHNREAGELLACVHQRLKLPSAVPWQPPPHVEREIRRAGESWSTQNQVFLHCDFSAVNILVNADGRLILIDASPNQYFTKRPDLVGPPVVDIATYTARLCWPFRLRFIDHNWRRLAKVLRTEFLSSYEQASGNRVDRSLLTILEQGVVRSFVELKTRSPAIVLPAILLGRLAMPKFAAQP